MKVLCAGDLHMGRRPSRLPADAEPSITTTRGWATIVQRAIAERVQLVALSGDLVDRANRFGESVGPLEDGLRQLARHGIRTVAVAGNHDFDVLPQLADTLGPDAFRLLGRGGRWEETIVESAGERLRIVGWSFPQEHVAENPMGTYPWSGAPTVPTLGLLHADLDVAGSRYAPVRLSDLQERQLELWLLGHIHVPRLVAPGVLYPGSPMAMDPGEMGAHGVWITDLGAGHQPRPTLVPCSPVRYDTIAVDLSGCESEQDLNRTITNGIHDQAIALGASADGVRHLVLRVRLTGVTPLHRVAMKVAAELQAGLNRMVDDMSVTVDRMIPALQAPHDLEALAEERNPAGTLARLLLALRNNTPSTELDAALERARREAGDIATHRYYSPVAGRGGIDDGALRAMVARQSELLLDALRGQREAP
jgi:DNA repair protein SbcD/Mre11